MRKFNIGDIVLSTVYSIEKKIVLNENGFRVEPYIEDRFFNRTAYISGTYKSIMESRLGIPFDDKDEYQITFLDDNNTLSWVSSDNLVLIRGNYYV